MFVFVFVKCYNRNVSFWPCRPNHLFFSSFLWQFLPIVTVLEFCFARLFPAILKPVHTSLVSSLFWSVFPQKLWENLTLRSAKTCFYLTLRIPQFSDLLVNLFLTRIWRVGAAEFDGLFSVLFSLDLENFFFFLIAVSNP